jgi:hypothetical protein
MKKWINELAVIETQAKSLLETALEKNGGILRLAPCWVPRSFLHPGKRLKLHPSDLYAYGLERGGIDERWFASTTEAANDGRLPDEGLSYVFFDDSRVTLKHAVEVLGSQIVGDEIWRQYGRWPVYSKFFDNMGPIPHHMHQQKDFAALVGQEGKPESYYFPPQHNYTGNNFPFTFFGLNPGTTREDVIRCLENWKRGDNGILDLSRAYRLEPGTGWQVGTGTLHAPGSFVTYEPQWGSDVFGMYQSQVEGREVPWSLLVKDMPPERHQDLEFIVDQLDWEANTDPYFKQNHFLKPLVDEENSGDGFTDRWVCYGSFKGWQAFTAKELTIEPGVSCTVRDNGAYGMITVQGEGTMNKLEISSPSQIRFGELTNDEIFCTASAAKEGVVFENRSDKEPLVMLRYFGPDVNPQAPELTSIS